MVSQLSNSKPPEQLLISVCLPVRNGAAYLSTAIESVLHQDYQNFELLISDDCSSDESREIIKNYACQDDRIIWWKNEQPLGLFANYNKCLERAQGEFIKPFAQDDLLSTSLLSKQLSFLKQHSDVSLVAAQREFIDANGKPIQNLRKGFRISEVLGQRDFYNFKEIANSCLFPLVNIIGEPCAVMFRAKDKGEGFSEKYKHLGDIDYWFRLLKLGDLGMIHEPLVFFRKHNNSATSNNVNELWANTDIIHLADTIGDALALMARSKVDFIKYNFSYSGKYVPRSSNGSLDFSRISEKDDFDRSDVASLKRAFLISLSMLDEENNDLYLIDKEMEEIEQNSKIIIAREARLRRILKSWSWIVTRPLREINKLLNTGSEKSLENYVSYFDSVLLEQREYLRHLKKTESRIFSSRSWKVTRFLRDGGLPIEENETIYTAADDQSSSKEQPFDSENQIELLKARNNLPDLIKRWVDTILTCKQEEWLNYILPKENGSSSKSDYVVFLSHDASRTGAPQLLLNIVKSFSKAGFECISIFKDEGPLLQDFRRHSHVLNLTGCEEIDTVMDLLVSPDVLEKGSGTFYGTIANSIESLPLAEPLAKWNYPLIYLVHELSNGYSKNQLKQISQIADKVTFPAEFARQSFVEKCKIPDSRSVILPQGLLEPVTGSGSQREIREAIRERLGLDQSAFLVLSCGTFIMRKGIDWFVDAAKRTLKNNANKDIHFVWIGEGEDHPFSLYYYCQRDIQNYGISKNVHFTGEIVDRQLLNDFFLSSDLFLMVSREDPFPCVSQMAMAAGLPVIAFEDAGGTPELLARGGGTIVDYGDTDKVAKQVLEYFNNHEMRLKHSIQAKRIIDEHYRFEDYFFSLKELLLNGSIDPLENEKPGWSNQINNNWLNSGLKNSSLSSSADGAATVNP